MQRPWPREPHQCLRTGEEASAEPDGGSTARTEQERPFAGVSPSMCAAPTRLPSWGTQSLQRTLGGVHMVGAEGDGGCACAGNDVGTRTRGHTLAHSPCRDTRDECRLGEAQGLEQALCPSAPSPAHTPAARRSPTLPLSLALQQSSCSKLIEFSAWEGPGEWRKWGLGRRLVNRSGLLPPGSPPLRWGRGGQALAAWEQCRRTGRSPHRAGPGDERRPGLRAGCCRPCHPTSHPHRREWGGHGSVDAGLSWSSGAQRAADGEPEVQARPSVGLGKGEQAAGG